MVIIKYFLLTKSEVMEYVWKSSLWIGTMYISNSYTTTNNTIDQQHTEQGQLVSTITSYNFIINPLGPQVTNINFS